MNGIMPGPLFLAIASASHADSSENATLTHSGKSATVTGKNPSAPVTTRFVGSTPEAPEGANRRDRFREKSTERQPKASPS